MTAPDPALTRALDHLTMQVDRDNVLAAHKAFRDHADALDAELRTRTLTTRLGLCGGDPVSSMVAGPASVGGKVDALLEVHRAHQRELVAAADHLRRIAAE